MIFVGIDIAKETHFAAVMNKDGEVLVDPFAFNNTRQGFDLLLNNLKNFPKEEVLIGLESTAHYAENLIFFLHSIGFKLAVINPIQTATLRKTGIRKTKTDKVDSLLIIKSLMINSFRLYTDSDMETLKLKTLCRFLQNLKKSKARLKIQLVTYVDMLFPELQNFFKSGLHIKACYELLKKHSAPDEIAALHLTGLSNLLHKASRGRFGKDTAAALKSLAKSSVGIKNASLSIQITQTIAQIELLEQQINDIKTTLAVTMEQLDSVIMTVPGIGAVNGAMILGEIGNINRFSKPCKLLAYAGLDPTVYQSGKFKADKTRMSKRGSKVLRYALVNSAWQLTLNNQTFAGYYDLKRSQGLNHYAALGHTAHKLVRILFKLLKHNLPFDLP
jgi:transposase